MRCRAEKGKPIMQEYEVHEAEQLYNEGAG